MWNLTMYKSNQGGDWLLLSMEHIIGLGLYTSAKLKCLKKYNSKYYLNSIW